MSAIDIVNANGQDYDIMSPEVVSDYVEKLGTICKNPNGYTRGSLFLARDDQGVERMYKATANISSNQTITVGTNCEHKKLGDLFNAVDSEVGNVKQALSDEANASAITGVKNVHPYPYYRASGYQHNGYTFNYDSKGVFTINGTLESGKTSGYIQLLTKGDSADFVELLKSAAFKIISTQVSNSVYIAFDWYDANDSYISEIKYKANGDKVVVPSNAKYLATYITVEASSLTNYEFAFMVAPVNVTDPTFQPYAMTNRELTNRYVIATETVELTGDGTNFYVAKTQATNPPTGYVAVGVVGVSTTTNSKIISNADIVGVSKSLMITAMTYNGAAWPTTDTATATVKVLFEKQ